MSRINQQGKLSETARAERLDALVGGRGNRLDRALTYRDLDGVILSTILNALALQPVPITEVMGTTLLMKPATGVYAGNVSGGLLTPIAGAAGREIISPFSTPFDLAIDRIGLSITTAVAASTLKITIYSANAAGQPDKVLLETSDIDGATTGTKFIDVPFTFRLGAAYWVGVRFSAATTIRFGENHVMTPVSWTEVAAPAPSLALRRSLSYATPATDWSYTSADHGSDRAPLILMRVA